MIAARIGRRKSPSSSYPFDDAVDGAAVSIACHAEHAAAVPER